MTSFVYRAPKAETREERYALFTEAETMLMEEMPIIPIYTYTSKHLIHPSVEGLSFQPHGLIESQICEAGAGAHPAGGAPLMLRFMFIRILQALPVIFVVITATFFSGALCPRRSL